MAEGTKLVLQFDTMSGSRTWSFNNANSSTTLVNVKNLAQTMIQNASLFQYQPVALRSAKTVTTSENVYDLDS